MDTNTENKTTVVDNNKCKNCGKRLPASKFCMYCGCNNKEETNVSENDNKNDEDIIVEENKNVNRVSLENGYFSSNKPFILPISVLIVALILCCVGFLFGGFSGLFVGSLVDDNSIPSDVKILSDKEKNIYYLKNGKVMFSNVYADKEEEEEIDPEKEKYFPSEKEPNFLAEINENEIIDFDFTDAFSTYGNQMLFLSKDKLFVVDGSSIETIMLNDTTRSNSAAVSYFNHEIYSYKYSKIKNYINEKDYKYFDYDESNYNDLLYALDNNKFSYYENGNSFYSSNKLTKMDIKVSDFDIKNKRLYYSDSGNFVFGDGNYIYILNRKGIFYKDKGFISDNKKINVRDIKHVFMYNDYTYAVITNDGKMYDFYYDVSDEKFVLSDGSDEGLISESNNKIVSLFSSLSFDNMDFKSGLILLLLVAGFIFFAVNLYLKMHSDYITKMFSGLVILGSAFSLFLIMFSHITFKGIVLNIISGFGMGFIVANFCISFVDILCFILNTIRVNTIVNYVLSFILFIVICLLSLEYNFILLLLIFIHIVWFVYVNNEIEFNRTYKINDKKIYYIVSFVSLVLILGGLFLGYSFLPEVKREAVKTLLPTITFLLAAFAPSIYLQKNFDFFMYLRMILMGAFMYLTPGIINFTIGIFESLGLAEGMGEVLGYLFKLIIILIILIVFYVLLSALIHVVTRYVVSFVTKKIKLEGFILQTSLAILLYVIVGVTALVFGIPLINEIAKLLFNLFFGDKSGIIGNLL